MNVKDNIRVFRKEAEMTQKDLAQELNVSIMTIQRYESGASVPSLEKIEEIAAALGVTSQEILHGRIPKYGFVDSSGVPTTLVMLDKEYWDPNKEPQREAPKPPTAEDIERDLKSGFDKLNYVGKKVASERVNELTLIKKYTE